jgi:signal transduction histidine kinase
MSESYSGEAASAAERALARDLVARLFPSLDAALLTQALLAERAAGDGSNGGEDPASLELRRARRVVAMGESARTVQHAMNNPLTALLAEAQLLELEPLAEEHLRAVGRIIELARRVVKVARRLDGSGS